MNSRLIFYFFITFMSIFMLLFSIYRLIPIKRNRERAYRDPKGNKVSPLIPNIAISFCLILSLWSTGRYARDLPAALLHNYSEAEGVVVWCSSGEPTRIQHRTVRLQIADGEVIELGIRGKAIKVDSEISVEYLHYSGYIIEWRYIS